MKIGDLVQRSKENAVTPAELADVAALLAAGSGGEDTYQLLYVIARSGATQYEPLVASFLEHRDDPMIARLALQTLTRFWNLTDRYAADLKRFLSGVDWDEDEDIRGIAISASGDYLADTEDRELLAELLRLGAPDNPDKLQRRFATEALAAALGAPLGAPVDHDAVREQAQRRYEATS